MKLHTDAEIQREHARVARQMAEARRVAPPPNMDSGRGMLGRRSAPANYPQRVVRSQS